MIPIPSQKKKPSYWENERYSGRMKKKIFFFKVFIKMSSCLFSQNKKYIALAKKF